MTKFEANRMIQDVQNNVELYDKKTKKNKKKKNEFLETIFDNCRRHFPRRFCTQNQNNYLMVNY